MKEKIPNRKRDGSLGPRERFDNATCYECEPPVAFFSRKQRHKHQMLVHREWPSVTKRQRRTKLGHIPSEKARARAEATRSSRASADQEV